MKILKFFLILSMVLLPVIGNSSEGDDLEEIKLHALDPTGNIQRSPKVCEIHCMYEVDDRIIYIFSDKMDQTVLQISVTNLLTNLQEYSIVSCSAFIREVIPLSCLGVYYIEITTSPGIVYVGYLFAY